MKALTASQGHYGRMVHRFMVFHSLDIQIVPHFPWSTMREDSPLQMSYCALVIELARMLGNADRVSKFPSWRSVATIYFNWPILYPGSSFSFFIIKQWLGLLHNSVFFSIFLLLLLSLLKFLKKKGLSEVGI